MSTTPKSRCAWVTTDKIYIDYHDDDHTTMPSITKDNSHVRVDP